MLALQAVNKQTHRFEIILSWQNSETIFLIENGNIFLPFFLVWVEDELITFILKSFIYRKLVREVPGGIKMTN